MIILSVQRQKGLTGYCFKYIDRPFCLHTDDFICSIYSTFIVNPSVHETQWQFYRFFINCTKMFILYATELHTYAL